MVANTICKLDLDGVMELFWICSEFLAKILPSIHDQCDGAMLIYTTQKFRCVNSRMYFLFIKHRVHNLTKLGEVKKKNV